MSTYFSVSATIFSTTSPMNYLQFTGNSWIAAMDLASMQMISNFSIVTAKLVTDVDCDPVTERIYWTEELEKYVEIRSAARDGSNVLSNHVGGEFIPTPIHFLSRTIIAC